MDAPHRPTLDRDVVGTALVAPWTQLMVVAATRSTNADLLAAASTTSAGSVLVAEHQTAGHGRLDREWVTPRCSAITLSVLLRPAVPVGTWGWLSLLAGVAVCDAVTALGIRAALKWPNDLLVGPADGKAAGILAQVADDAVVLGIGLNVSMTRDELPVPSATSLELVGGETQDRSRLLVDILARLGRRYQEWLDASGDAQRSGLASDYRQRCATIGRRVAVTAIDGAVVEATARRIDADGRLVLDLGGGTEQVVAAGDVAHVRAPNR